jgi:hypothetical protein
MKMAFVVNTPLAQQPTAVLVALYHHSTVKVDANGHLTPGIRRITRLLRERNYPLRKLLTTPRRV